MCPLIVAKLAYPPARLVDQFEHGQEKQMNH